MYERTFILRETKLPSAVNSLASGFGPDRIMVKSVEGVYRDGKVDLLESLDEAEGSRVVVTWISPPFVDLRERGIDDAQAADLRRRLVAFADDWSRPEMYSGRYTS